MNQQAYMDGYLDKTAKKKKDKQSWTPAECAEFEKKHGKPPELGTWGVSFFKDKDGYYCTTHRARSKSKKSPDKITKTELEFIESTG